MGPSPVHLLIVLLVILLLFGATRLGDLGKGLGEGVRNFKKGLAGDDKDDDAKKLEGKGKGSQKES
jgi:sec-independent protein translocase protein TatA